MVVGLKTGLGLGSTGAVPLSQPANCWSQTSGRAELRESLLEHICWFHVGQRSGKGQMLIEWID